MNQAVPDVKKIIIAQSIDMPKPSSDKPITVKKQPVNNNESIEEPNFELSLNTEVTKLEHLNKSRPKRDRNKKPSTNNVSNQLIETIELNEDLVVFEESHVSVIKPDVRQPKISIDDLQRIQLRKTPKIPNETKDAKTTVQAPEIATLNKKPIAKPKQPIMIPIQNDSTHSDQSPAPFVRLRPVHKTSSQPETPTGHVNNQQTSSESAKIEQDKRQSVSVKERIQFLSEESKV